MILLPNDYETLKTLGIAHLEDEGQRYLVLLNVALPPGQYVQSCCDVLIKIPTGYNDEGIDMFWTYPRLQLACGSPIAATLDTGSTENTQFNGREYCRWSRHWNQYQDTPWKPGTDAVHTIHSRVKWCLNNPNRSL